MSQTMNASSLLTSSLAFAVAICVSTGLAVANTQTVQDQLVLVRIQVDNAYNDSERSLAEIQQLLSVLPSTVRMAVAGDTVSSIIVDQYGFGQKNLPRTYRLLESTILALNNLPSGSELHPGPIMLPFLPKRAYTDVSPFNLRNTIPTSVEIKVERTQEIRPMPAPAIFGAASAAIAQAQAVLNEFTRITLPTRLNRRAAQGVLIDVELDRSLVDVQPWADFIQSAKVTISSSALVVKFANDRGSPADTPVLSAPDEDVIRKALATTTRTRTLVVLDSGWPDAESLAESIQFFRDLFSDIRRHYSLLPANVAWPAPDHFVPPVPNHCVHVKEALDGLRALDRSHVRVVYLPIGLNQGSGDIIRELVELHFILGQLSTPWNRWRADRSVPKDVQQDGAKHARDIVNHLSSTGEGTLARTDSVVVDALSTVLSYAGDARNENFFINESWTVDADVVKYARPAVPHALVVVAAGNDGKDVVNERVDFAQRGLTDAYVLAVMNLTASGDLDCCGKDEHGHPVLCSGKVSENVLADFAGVGFNGRTANACGTSIASPRIAWLLAAAEAAQPKPLAAETWVAQLRKALRDSRSTAAGYAAVSFSVQKFFKVWLVQ